MPTTPENTRQCRYPELIGSTSPELVAAQSWMTAPMLTLPPLTTDHELPVTKPVWMVRVAAPDMKFEDKRFASFDRCSSLPPGFFITRLAQRGYYFDHRLRKISCFCCGRERESGHTLTCQPARSELNVPFLQQALQLQQGRAPRPSAAATDVVRLTGVCPREQTAFRDGALQFWKDNFSSNAK